MKLVESIPYPYRKHLLSLTETLQRAGYSCYLVGGSVRDLYMGKIPNEYDLTTNARPEIVRSLFRKVFDTGIQHGTVTVVLDRIGYEVTTYRSEKGYSDGRRPDGVEFSDYLEEDLKRRDFTMNALCLDIVSGELVDLHKGLEDIQNRIIRTIGDPLERFSEDGLRPIRGIRFASTLGFDLDPATEEAFSPTRSITAKVSIERVQVEMGKILRSSLPKRGVELLVRYDYFSLFLTFPLREEPCYEYFPLWTRVRESFFQEKTSIPWFFFVIIWFDTSLFTLKSNPIREFKLSNEVEKEVFFLLERFRFLEEFAFNNPTDPLLCKNFLAPIRDFTNKSSWTETELREFFLDSVIPFLLDQKIGDRGEYKESEIMKNIRRILDMDLPLVLKDLVVNGNWIVDNIPGAFGKKIGILLDKSLEAIWKGEAKNEESSIKDYLTSHPEFLA